MEKLTKLSSEIYAANKAKGFYDKPRENGTTLMLIVSELAEAMEADRGRGNTLDRNYFERGIQDYPDSFEKFFKENVKDTYEDELADALIRILDHCGAKNIDIGWHVEQKLKYNATRARLHGKVY